jgi:hypothetical protein
MPQGIQACPYSVNKAIVGVLANNTYVSCSRYLTTTFVVGEDANNGQKP